MDKLPEKAIVGRTKIDTALIATDMWRLAKEEGSVKDALACIKEKWKLQDNKRQILNNLLKEPDKVVIISVPGSSHKNKIPVCLGEGLAKRYRCNFIDGNQLFQSDHNIASKKIYAENRLFQPRLYTQRQRFSNKNNKSVLIVDDVLTTGGSIKQLCRTLNKAGVKIKGVVCLMGDPRIRITESTNKAINKAMKEKFPDMPIRKRQNFCANMTQGEGFNFSKTLNKTKTADARQALSLKINKVIEHDRQFLRQPMTLTL